MVLLSFAYISWFIKGNTLNLILGLICAQSVGYGLMAVGNELSLGRRYWSLLSFCYVSELSMGLC